MDNIFDLAITDKMRVIKTLFLHLKPIHMKTISKSIFHVLTVVSAALLMSSCEKSVISKQPSANASTVDALTYEEQAYEVPLHIDPNATDGSVVVNNDDNYLYVTYNTQNGWKILAAQTKAKNALTYVVSSNKDISPGQFPYKRSLTNVADDISSLPDTYTFAIPISAIEGIQAKKGNQVKIYAHATLVRSTDGVTTESQSAWAGEMKNFDDHKLYGEIIYNVAEIEGVK